MLLRYNLTLAFALFCAIGLYMLGAEEGMMQAEFQGSSQLVSKGKTSEKPGGKADEKAKEADATEESAESKQDPAQVAFVPPFPDRSNPFQAPKRQGRASVKSRGQSESAVELLGFVNVNGPRVALSIGGFVTTAAEGDTEAGIEVISIKPPAVLLKRGRQRWQATLEN